MSYGGYGAYGAPLGMMGRSSYASRPVVSGSSYRPDPPSHTSAPPVPVQSTNRSTLTKPEGSKVAAEFVSVGAGTRNEASIMGWDMSGERLATGTGRGELKVWPTEKLASKVDPLHDFGTVEGDNGIVALSWSPVDLDRFVISCDKGVRLYDLRHSQTKCHKDTYHPSKTAGILKWNKSGGALLLGGNDSLTVMDTRKEEPVAEIQNEGNMDATWFTKNGQDYVALTKIEGVVEVFDSGLRPLGRVQVSRSKLGPITSSEDALIVGGFDASIYSLDLDELTCTKVFTKLTTSVHDMSINHDRSAFAYAADQSNIEIADSNLVSLCTISTTVDRIGAVCWHTKKNWLAYTSPDSLLCLARFTF